LKGDWALGEDNWKDENDVNLLTLSTLVQARVLNCVTVLPAGVEGAVYLCKSDHATKPNNVAVYDEGAWVYYAPFEGMAVYDLTSKSVKRYDGAAWRTVATNRYRLAFSIENNAPLAGEVLLRHVFVAAVTFADDFAGSVARLPPGGGNPAANQVFSIKHNNVAVGTLTISTTGVVTWATTAAALTVAIGDELRIEAPVAVDAAIIGMSATLLGVE